MKDGGSAFPKIIKLWNTQRDMDRDDFTVESIDGMSLRDWFAAAALQGWMSTFTDSAVPISTKAQAAIAEFCFSIADAMIAEREKEPK